MAYNQEIPKPKDKLSASQGDLLGNFQALNTQFAVNHVAFDDASADKGKHNFITFVQQASDPETKADEYILFSKDDGSGATEIFARPESNGTVYQFTKEGNIYLGLLPVVAVNFNTTGAIQGSSLNVTSVTRPGATGRYVVNFTNALPDNNYFWSASGFDNSSNPVIAQVTNTNDYATVVTTTSISIDFKNQNNTLVGSLTRGCVICWRYQ